jgi:rSAM/selenodomain-associated transferase 2
MANARKSPPILSIIVPVRNRARTIGPTLHALKPFRDRNAEIIAVDGGSTDDTALLARPLADQVIRSPQGLGRQMNEGAKVANGFIFLFLRPETKLPLDADTQVMVGRSRDTAVWGRFDLRLSGRHMLLPLVARFLNWRSRVSGIASGEQAIFVQRETFFRIGGFRHIPVLEDVDLCERLREISPPICVTSRVTVPGDRFDRDGIWKTLRRMTAMRWRYRLGAKPEDLAKRYRYESAQDSSWPGLSRPSTPSPKKDVDARHKAGHDADRLSRKS